MTLPTQFGEAFAGDGVNAAHLNTVLGTRGGPVETAWVTALASPRPGHAAFVAVLRPGLATRPPTLFVNKAGIEHDGHARLTWGAAQAGVAAGVADSVADGVVPAELVSGLLLIAAVWVDPRADDEGAVFANNRAATAAALADGRAGGPSVEDTLSARDNPTNPFFAS